MKTSSHGDRLLALALVAALAACGGTDEGGGGTPQLPKSQWTWVDLPGTECSAQFEAAVRQLATDVIAPLPNAKTFLVPGETHTMVGAPQQFTSGGVPLVEWLRREVEDDPAWQSVGP
jgi:hypothetical protein